VWNAIARWRSRTQEDLTPKLRVGSTELNSLLKAKKRSALREDIESVTETATVTRFAVRRKGETEDETQ
jgi:hypothetical protein